MHIDAMPYAPGGHGPMGHNGDFRKDRLGVLQQLADVDTPLMRLRLPIRSVKAVVVNAPDLIQESLVDHGRVFDKSGMLRFALFPLAGEGLFTSNGELWQRQRRLMAPMFQPRALEAYAQDMVQIAERTCAEWKDGETLQLLHETTRLTMSVAGKTLFDADTFTEADEIGNALTVALSWTGWMIGRPYAIAHVLTRRKLVDSVHRFPPLARPFVERAIDHLRGPVALVGPRGRKLRKALAVLDETVQHMIEERRASPHQPGDLMSRLLAARDEDDGTQMSDRQVRDELLTLFVAGHETTATGLAWSIYLASRHPKTYAALEAEVDALGHEPTLADLPKLGLCLRVFKEALRLYPPVYMFGRDTNRAVSVGGYELPKNTNFLVSPWALHRKASLWPDPLVFDPDRFLPEAEAKRNRYAYLPFGAGPRTCIGNHFAYMEAQLALAVLLRRYRFESLRDDEPFPEATLRPRHGVVVRVSKRPRSRVTRSGERSAES